MAKIIQPTYICKQPSTGKNIKFRPFVVKEEKTILLALQENNIDTVVETIKNVVNVCTDGAIDANKVPYYDVEYIYLHIRSKSIGEIIELVGSCDCNETTNFSCNIEDTFIEPIPSGLKHIKIVGTQYTLAMQHPNISGIANSLNDAEDTSTQTVADCIVSVYTEDEVMAWNEQETLEFVESMTSLQQTDIVKFLEEMPVVKLPAKYTCKGCGSVHDTPLSGFSNFFL